MRIVEINGTNYAATGNIVNNIATEARKVGYDVYTCCKNSKTSQRIKLDNQIYIGTRLERVICEELAYIFGYDISMNYFGTRKFIKTLEKIKPDLIHLHVIHSTYINIPMLFRYINKNSIPVIWTFHDSWAFTGSCVEFECKECFKWKVECNNCPLVHGYPKSLFLDNSKLLFNKKKKIFTSLEKLTIVTPSKWLANYAKDSFFNKYPIKVINNGIDLNVYRQVKTNFKKEHNIENKFLILGVANGWSNNKGVEDFIELSKRLSNKYQIVLVGTSNKIDEILPKNIISIHKTQNQNELVYIYSAADVFVNPTKNDNFPTVNIESLACGTPVVTYDVGGCAETIDSCGICVKKNDIDGLEKAIIDICEEHKIKRENCTSRANSFDSKAINTQYVSLINEILGV